MLLRCLPQCSPVSFVLLQKYRKLGLSMQNVTREKRTSNITIGTQTEWEQNCVQEKDPNIKFDVGFHCLFTHYCSRVHLLWQAKRCFDVCKQMHERSVPGVTRSLCINIQVLICALATWFVLSATKLTRARGSTLIRILLLQCSRTHQAVWTRFISLLATLRRTSRFDLLLSRLKKTARNYRAFGPSVSHSVRGCRVNQVVSTRIVFSCEYRVIGETLYALTLFFAQQLEKSDGCVTFKVYVSHR